MKALAEFVMRGRAQALMIAVAGAVIVLFAWVSAAVVALVTLRKGPAEGVWLLAWALLPAAIIAWRFGDTSAVALLLGTASLALVLRATVSLSLALLASVAVGVAAGILMLSVGEAYLEQVRIELVEPYVAYLEQYASRNGEMVTLPRPGAIAIAGMIGTGTSTLSILSLLLARWIRPGVPYVALPRSGESGSPCGGVADLQPGGRVAYLGDDRCGAADVCGPRPGACAGAAEGLERHVAGAVLHRMVPVWCHADAGGYAGRGGRLVGFSRSLGQCAG